MTPNAVDAGFVETDTSPCNAAGHDVTVGLDLCVGVEINSSYIWQITSSVGNTNNNIRTRQSLLNVSIYDYIKELQIKRHSKMTKVTKT